MWEYIQHLALKHKQIGAGAKQASDNIQRRVQGLGEEIWSLGQLPQGIDQARLHSKIYFHWLKPQMEKIGCGQEIAHRIVDRKHYVHPAGEPTLGPGGQDLG
eukprot:7315236-Karenia_brevis.AAC.1